jgi:hypothetical protein
MNLNELGLLITEDIYVIKDEIQQRLLAERISQKHGVEDMIVPEPEDRDLDTAAPGLPAEPVTSNEEDAIPLEYEGEYQKNVLVLYQGEGLAESSRAFLMKVLNAVNCSLKDIALLSEEAIRDTREEHLLQLNPQKMIVFGTLHHPVMGRKKENYHIIQEDVECFFADELSDLENNVSLKKELWGTLQRFFNIKK